MPNKNQLLSIRSFPRAILHLDGDAFFASVEQALNPKLKGKPVVTGKERGIVTAASYEAKAQGIKRGVKLWDVKKICPEAIIISSNYENYDLFSRKMFEIIRQFTPTVEEYSIDEAFAEITGFQRPYHASYKQIAERIKTEVEKSLNITVSVGLSISKVLAKVGSKWNKPSGLTTIPGYKIQEFLKDLPVGKIWGIGNATAAFCNALGIKTALQYAQKSEEFIKKNFTKPHQEIWMELNGHSVFPLNTAPHTTFASISKFRTFTPPSKDKFFIYAQLQKNLENACIKARRYNLVAQELIIALKSQDFRVHGLKAKLSRASAFPNDMFTIAKDLFQKIYNPEKEYRATGVVLNNLRQEQGIQMNLFEPSIKIEKLKKIYDAVDSLAAKYGKHTIHTGASTLAHNKKQHLQDQGYPIM